MFILYILYTKNKSPGHTVMGLYLVPLLLRAVMVVPRQAEEASSPGALTAEYPKPLNP